MPSCSPLESSPLHLQNLWASRCIQQRLFSETQGKWHFTADPYMVSLSVYQFKQWLNQEYSLVLKTVITCTRVICCKQCVLEYFVLANVLSQLCSDQPMGHVGLTVHSPAPRKYSSYRCHTCLPSSQVGRGTSQWLGHRELLRSHTDAGSSLQTIRCHSLVGITWFEVHCTWALQQIHQARRAFEGCLGEKLINSQLNLVQMPSLMKDWIQWNRHNIYVNSLSAGFI